MGGNWEGTVLFRHHGGAGQGGTGQQGWPSPLLSFLNAICSQTQACSPLHPGHPWDWLSAAQTPLCLTLCVCLLAFEQFSVVQLWGQHETKWDWQRWGWVPHLFSTLLPPSLDPPAPLYINDKHHHHHLWNSSSLRVSFFAVSYGLSQKQISSKGWNFDKVFLF